MNDRCVGSPDPRLRATMADISLPAFLHNLDTARTHSGPGLEIMAVLKSDGYGHGAVPLARAAVEAGCPILGVATVAEGLSLRAAGIGVDILVFGGIPPGAEEASLMNRLSAVLYDLPSAGRLDRAARALGRKLSVHLKFDTGMGRLGFLPD
jgi:alanine racemase